MERKVRYYVKHGLVKIYRSTLRAAYELAERESTRLGKPMTVGSEIITTAGRKLGATVKAKKSFKRNPARKPSGTRKPGAEARGAALRGKRRDANPYAAGTMGHKIWDSQWLAAKPKR